MSDISLPQQYMFGQDGEITALLHRWKDGSVDAENQLFHTVMPELLKLARYFMKRERSDHSLQACDLVDQVYFKLVAAKNCNWCDRAAAVAPGLP